MFELGLVVQFEAAHHLEGPFGPAARMHGHTYRVEVAIEGERLGTDGTLFDLGRLQEAVREVIEPLHYRNLDDIADFQGRNTTVETVAEYLANSLAASLHPSGLKEVHVRVWESPQVFAGCRLRLEGDG